MRKIFTILSVAVIAFGITSCDSTFDKLEGDLTKMSAEDLTQSEAGLDRLVANLYSAIPMDAFAELDKSTQNAVSSDGSSTLSNNITSFWNYTTMRSINMFIKQLDEAKEKGTITDNVYKKYLGEAKFVRAYCYFASVRVYGGIPIVTEPLDDLFDGGENAGLYIPRSTEKDTWDFILKELDEAAALLPETTEGFRANKWAALGLKSRVALHAASESKYWDNAPIESKYLAVQQKLTYMEPSYANAYFQQCIDACNAIINSGRFSLYGAMPTSVAEAKKNYSDLFLARQDCEYIFGKSYNNGVSTNSNGVDLKNSPNQIHGSGTGVWKFGCYGITLDIVDLYDNYDANFNAVDGTIKTRQDGKEDEYITTPGDNAGMENIKKVDFIKYASPADPFKDKDARFLASVIYPDAEFRGVTIKIQGGIWKTNGELRVYDESNPSDVLNGVTYYALGADDIGKCSGFYKRGATNDGSWYYSGFGLRKFLDYNKPVSESQNPWYDIRYAEILLNYCEAIVELQGANAGNSKQYLNDIRRRAYFLDQRDATLENILKERRIELAFENDYSYTLYRRRAFWNELRDAASNPLGGRTHALIPIVDLQNGSAGYIFVRTNFFGYDIDRRSRPTSVVNLAYYGAIPNYTMNDITANPSQE